MILTAGSFVWAVLAIAAMYCYVTGVDDTLQAFWFGFGIFIASLLTQLLWEAYKWRWWRKQ